MAIVAMQPVQQAGVGVSLYLADDNNRLYSLNFNGSNALLEEGAYHQVITGGEAVANNAKRGKRLIVEGSGVNVTAQLLLEMDGERTLVQNLSGPYDRTKGILFYCEFDPAMVTAKTFIVRLNAINGTDVRIGDIRFEFTLID